MPCNAVGTFPKAIPFECVKELLEQVKNKAPVGQMIQTFSMALGQIGALLPSKEMPVGSASVDETTSETVLEIEQLMGFDGSMKSLQTDILINMLMPLLMKLLNSIIK